jgi:hypothetical protein
MKKILQFFFGIIFPTTMAYLCTLLTCVIFNLHIVTGLLAKVDMFDWVAEIVILAAHASASFISSRYLFLWILMNKIYKDGKFDF